MKKMEKVGNKKRRWKIGLLFLGLLLSGVLWFIYTPVDLRPNRLKGKIAAGDYAKGKELLIGMQRAYGGMDNWLAFGKASYAQTADWYDDKLGLSGWDALPQQFQMTSTLGTDDSELTLLNGKNAGQTWGTVDWKSYQKMDNGHKVFKPNDKYLHKLIFKNYWFQFPFRISEAPIIAYAGESTIEGEAYDLLYITWGTEVPNRTYDQYLLYLDKETRMVEWLNFTLREKVNFINMTAQFADFKTINGIAAPFTQYITFGRPGTDGRKMHENRYDWIEFGGERVLR